VVECRYKKKERKKERQMMTEFAVWITVNGNDKRIGKVFAHNEREALSLIPQKYKNAGKVFLVAIVIEE
jgi:hypothetical protein